MRPDLPSLLESKVVLLDGGMGTSLFARGLALGACPASWNLEQPDQVRSVHEGFLRAGSDVIQTNTFGANIVALSQHGLENQAGELNRAGVRLAREAVEAAGHGWVAGNIGPTGLVRGSKKAGTGGDRFRLYADQVAALAEEGVDYFSLETLSDLSEARGMLAAVRGVSALPVTASFNVEERGGEWVTLTGVAVGEAFRAMIGEGVCAVGLNCSDGSGAWVDVVGDWVASVDVPFIVKPNRGLPREVDGRLEYGQSAQEFARDMMAMVRAGAGAIGGCCGADAEFVAALNAGLGGLED